MSAECQRCGWDLPYDGDCVVCDELGTFSSQLSAERGHLEAAIGERNDARQETVEARGQLDVEIAKRVEAIDRWDTSFREMEGLAKQVLAERNEAREERDDARREGSEERERFQHLLNEYSARMVEVREERSDLLVSRQGEQDRLSRVLAALPAIIFGVAYYDLGEHGVTWKRCVEVWEQYYVPALQGEHFGDCTKQPQACHRCQAEDVMRLFAIVRAGLG